MEKVTKTYLSCIKPGLSERPSKAQRLRGGEKDQLEVWSVRNKTKIHWSAIAMSKPEMPTLPSPYTFQTMAEFTVHCPTLLCGLTLHSVFLQEREGFSGHSRLADQDLFAQTLQIRMSAPASSWSSQPLLILLVRISTWALQPRGPR